MQGTYVPPLACDEGMNTPTPTRLRYVYLPLAGVFAILGLTLASERLWGLLVNSLLLAMGTLVIALPVGTFLAVVIAKTTLPGHRFLQRLLLATLFVPLLVQATAWQAALGVGGWLLPEDSFGSQGFLFGGWLGAIWVHALAAIPWVALIVAAALRSIPRELEEESLQDAPAWRVLLSVSLPHAAAGFLAAAIWIAILCFTEITVTDLFQVRTFAEEVYTSASIGSLVFDGSMAGGEGEQLELRRTDLVAGSLLALVLAMSVLGVLARRLSDGNWMSADASWQWQLRGARIPVEFCTWLLVAVVVGIPLVSLVGKAGAVTSRTPAGAVRQWSAFKTCQMVLRSPVEHRRELGWSGAIGGTAALLATGVGVLLAWVLRIKRGSRWPITALLVLALIIPGPVMGVWLIGLLNHAADSPLAWLNWWYDNTILAPVLAQFIKALPLATLVVWSQFVGISQLELDTAATDGANGWQQLIYIAIPGHWPAIAAAFCLALIVAVGELAATLLVVPPGVSTLSIRIFGLVHYGAEDRVSAAALMLALVTGSLASWALSNKASK